MHWTFFLKYGLGWGWGLDETEWACTVRTINTCTYTFPGPVIALQPSDVQYSDTTPYTRFTWLKKDIADGENNEKFKKILQKCQFCMKNIKDLKSLKKYIDALYRELDLNCKYKEAGHKWKYFCKSIYWCMYKSYKHLL